jgi:CRP-like cAMP-binding protein
VKISRMTAAAAKAALEQTILLGALDEATLDTMSARATVTRYRRGDPVVVEGEPGGDLLVVASGRLKVVSRSVDGIDVVLAIASAGDTLGELSLMDKAPRSATVEAAESSVVVRIAGDTVRDTIRAHPELAEELITQQAATIRRVSGMVADLVFLDVPRRVAKYVVERTDHRGQADLGLSQGELAAAVGGVRQTVNAALRGLERRGWIRMDGRTVTVHDRMALEEYAAVGAR